MTDCFLKYICAAPTLLKLSKLNMEAFNGSALGKVFTEISFCPLDLVNITFNSFFDAALGGVFVHQRPVNKLNIHCEKRQKRPDGIGGQFYSSKKNLRNE